MSLDDLEKLRSIRQGGKTKGKAKLRRLREEGKTRGLEVEYQDGRVETVVRPETVRVKLSVSDSEVL